jgi:hypothetical protein
MDRFSKTCLFSIAHETGKPCPLCSAQDLLDKYSADGWEFVALAPDGQFIFRK